MKYLIAVLLLLVSTPAYATFFNIERAYNGFVQLDTRYVQDGRTVTAGTYSGSVINETNDLFLILTCGHGPHPAKFNSTTFVRCFHYQGRASAWMRGQVVWYKYAGIATKDYTMNDLGLIVVKKSEFRRVRYPFPKPLTLSNRVPVRGEYVYSLGSSSTQYYSYPAVFRNYVSGYFTSRSVYTLLPAAKLPGRSGAPIFDSSGNILGMVLARDDNGVYAVSSYRIRQLFGEYNSWRAKK